LQILGVRLSNDGEALYDGHSGGKQLSDLGEIQAAAWMMFDWLSFGV
jgi:hypothetical protein